MTDKKTVEYNISQLDSISFLEGTNEEIKEEHEWVDLGLPSGTLWATCNVGASSPEEYGDYFAWGETEPKNDYSWSTYMHCNGTEFLTRYCLSESYGLVDYKIELKANDDVATERWGEEWQIPSLKQIQELMNTNYTTRTITKLKGVTGFKIQGKNNGNYIFLPLKGNTLNPQFANKIGDYWSRSLYTDDSKCAYNLELNSVYDQVYTTDRVLRFVGLSVRPVRVKK